ncbi:MAG: prepilin-type N-terminal cleavage/methylation domain-containing protein [Proteobacteria bacterium]|nr:prepilin-type N-terminal cleavage/methylation domain-containing protein [Pseudomonadota bacterium]
MKSSISQNNSTGFTLIEVMIAMTILSLILVLLFSTIFTANRSWQTTERKIAQNDELRLVGHFIQRQLSQNIPLMWIDQDERKLIFEGKNDELRFTSTLPAHRGGGGIQLITLKVNQTDDVHHLDLYYRHVNPDVSPFEKNHDVEQVTLLENINSIEFSYFGQENFDEAPVWRDEWQNKEILPTLISIKIHTRNESQDWPEMKIPLHSNYIQGQPQFILRKTTNTSI